MPQPLQRLDLILRHGAKATRQPQTPIVDGNPFFRIARFAEDTFDYDPTLTSVEARVDGKAVYVIRRLRRMCGACRGEGWAEVRDGPDDTSCGKCPACRGSGLRVAS